MVHVVATLLFLMMLASGEDRSFTITAFPPPGSSIVQVVPASDYLEVLAGVSYSYSIIACSVSYFGTSSSLVNAKIVSADTEGCSSGVVALVGPPFDGLTKPSQLTQLVTRWGSTKFDFAGNYTVCMNVSSVPTLLPVTIVAKGVTSDSQKLFCLFTMDTICTIKLLGNLMSGEGDARVALVPFSTGSCGTSSLSIPFNETTSTAVISEISQEIHSLGVLNTGEILATYKACYCPSFQASGGSAGVVCTELSANYPQKIGTLILITHASIDPLTGLTSAVYPRLKFDFNVLCGTGGCSSTTSPRLKIVDSNKFNLKPHYDSLGGCRFALQTERFLAPANCASSSSTDCALERSNSGDAAKISFSNLQLDNQLVNNVMIQRSYDVCFCDSICSIRDNWFYIGSFMMQPLSVDFIFDSLSVDRIAVKVAGSIRISGTTDGAFRVSGTQSREMKLLPDLDGAMDSVACMNTYQSSSFVVNHDCYSLTNCAVPISSTKSLQIYGNDLIEFRQAGWAAVCYCNAQCAASEINWFIVGRLLVAGPKGDQLWAFTVESVFSLSIDGYALRPTDSLKIIAASEADDCLLSPSSSSVTYTSQGTVLSGGPLGGISDGYDVILGGNGTVVDFTTAHNLNQGDRITLSGISTGDSVKDAMFNSDHSVSVLSSKSVWINVQFGPGEFPLSTDLSISSWIRTSRIDFEGISAQAPGTYTVCWIGGDSSASPAGPLVINDPSWD